MATQTISNIRRAAVNGSVVETMKSFWQRKLSRFGLLDLVVLVGILLYLLMTVIPLFMAFAFSLTNQNLLYKTSEFIGFDNYIDLLDDKSFIRSLG